MPDDVKYLAVTKAEAEFIADKFLLSQSATRGLVLRAISIVQEFEADTAAAEADHILTIHTAMQAELEPLHELRRRSESAVDGGRTAPPPDAA